jgi:predicted alpha/beta hydrolase family esterase
MSLATQFNQILGTLPPDWTDLEVDLRIDDESQYVDTAVWLSQVNAQVYQHPREQGWQWRLLVAHSFGHAAAPESVRGVLAKLDGEGVAGELGVAEVREGRSEVVQMWGRPESVREEFRQRRSI